jgi:hypothetical protein
LLVVYLKVSPKKILIMSAFDVRLFMCAFQVMLDEMATRRYFVVSINSRVCPFKM